MGNENKVANVFVIADTHFGDKNILTYERRPFATVEEMNNSMISRWNSVVGQNDTVFLLGDFVNLATMGFRDDLLCLLKDLNGSIKLIRGNHDTKELDILLSKVCNDLPKDKIVVYDYPIIYKGFWMLSHEPLYINTSMPYANIFGHVHNNPAYKTVSSHSYCVSAERLGYTPILFEHIVETVAKSN